MTFRGRHVMLTREGGYYLLVLLFIAGGAVLREVNLLVVLAGMLIGPLVFSWRWALASIAGLELSRKLPQRISAADPLIVELAVANRRSWLTSWAIRVVDVVERVIPQADGAPAKVEVVIPEIAPGNTASATYRCLLTQRGRYRFRGARISCQFPFGLVRASQESEAEDEIVVTPRLGRLTRRWQEWVRSEDSGVEHPSPRRGPLEGDFYGLRPWRSGDSQRWIHWRTTARLNELSVRQFEHKRSADVALVLDLWSDGSQSVAALGNLEIAVSLAATVVADVCTRGGARLTLAVHSSAPRMWNFPASHALAGEVLDYLATAEAAKMDGLGDSLSHVLAEASPGARLIVVSTRDVDVESMLAERAEDSAVPSMVSRTIWLDVSQREAEELFSLD